MKQKKVIIQMLLFGAQVVPMREFLHVDDLANAVVFALRKCIA
jgi:nucleoside-diphosphate-sugar epimerase